MKGAGPRTQSFVFGLAGFAALLFVWQVVGLYQLMGPSWPALSDVLRKLGDPNSFGLFQRAASATLASAAEGYVLGAAAGISLAMLARVAPLLGPGTSNLAALANSIPMIALGPIFLILMSRTAVPAAVASIHVLFICYVALNSGFKAATRSHQDLLTVLGASRLQRLLRLEIPAALPALANGLRLAVPVALIGALIGEWFGAPRGLGVLIVNAMENFQIVLLWSAVLLTATSSMLGYAIASLFQKLVQSRLT